MVGGQRERFAEFTSNRTGNCGLHLPSIALSRYYVMINALMRNIKGVSKAPNLRRLKHMIRMHGIQFVTISEPKLSASRVEYIRLKLSFDFALLNVSTNLWIFYNAPFSCLVVGSSNQHISLVIHHPWLSCPLAFSFVNTLCSAEGRRVL